MSQGIRKVWIEEGCISCKLCEDMVPDVFEVQGDGSCVIKPDAAAHFVQKADDIVDAARDCPVEVIKVDGGPAAPG